MIKILKIIGGIFCVFLIIGIIAQSGKGKYNPVDTTKTTSRAYILDNGWYVSGFGTVAIHDFTITNNHDMDISDITVQCIYWAPSGTIIDKNRKTVYQVIPAGKKKRIKEFSMGFCHSQSARSGCDIISYKMGNEVIYKQ
jgi:hypothetical protein